MLSWACKGSGLVSRACLDSVSRKNNVLTSATSTGERAELINTLRGVLAEEPDVGNCWPNRIVPPAGRAGKVHLECGWSIFAGRDASPGLGEGARGLHSRLYLRSVAQLLGDSCCVTSAVKQHYGHRFVIFRQDEILDLLSAQGFHSALLQIKRFRYWGGNDLESFLTDRFLDPYLTRKQNAFTHLLKLHLVTHITTDSFKTHDCTLQMPFWLLEVHFFFFKHVSSDSNLCDISTSSPAVETSFLGQFSGSLLQLQDQRCICYVPFLCYQGTATDSAVQKFHIWVTLRILPCPDDLLLFILSATYETFLWCLWHQTLLLRVGLCSKLLFLQSCLQSRRFLGGS